MTRAAELTQLVAMQWLKKQRCGGTAAEAQSDSQIKAAHAEDLDARKQATESALEGVFAARTFCPDRMLIAAGHLAEAEHDFDAAKQELDHAKEHELAARKAWQEAGFRHDILTGQARKALREEARRADDAAQAERMSLRAATQKGPRR